MPQKFDDMVDGIKKSLRKRYPKMKEEELGSRAYAIATSQWKKSHGGKLPGEKLEDWKVLEFFVPIEESLVDKDDFIIKGIAINETTTLNNVKYMASELERAAPTFRDVPILLDHKNEVKNIVGRTTQNVFFERGKDGLGRIPFEAKIRDVEIQNMIKDGRIKNVSIGAKVDDLIEEDDGSMRAVGVKGLELSFVAVPGDNQADFAQALTHNFHLKEMAENDEDKIDIDDEEEIDEQMMSDEEIRKKIKKEHPDLSGEEIEVMVKDMKKKMINQSYIDLTKQKEVKKMVEEEKIEEQVKPEVKAELNTENKVITEMRKEIDEMKAMIEERKKLSEELKKIEEKVDKTKGEVTEIPTEEKKIDSDIVLERAESGKFALYRDYTKEGSKSKLKRLVR